MLNVISMTAGLAPLQESGWWYELVWQDYGLPFFARAPSPREHFPRREPTRNPC